MSRDLNQLIRAASVTPDIYLGWQGSARLNSEIRSDNPVLSSPRGPVVSLEYKVCNHDACYYLSFTFKATLPSSIQALKKTSHQHGHMHLLAS